MPLGDSITASCCWRDFLFSTLPGAGYRVESVGSAGHEGHGGYAANNFTKPAGTTGIKPEGYYGDMRDLEVWFGPTAQVPDVVLMMLGTNDRWSGFAPNEILAGFDAALTAMRLKNPRVTLLVAKILPMMPADVTPLNAAIPSWAEARSRSTSRIFVVDQYTGFDQAWLRPTDGVHVDSTQGNQWISEHWFATLATILQK